jgi:hypothetical protein
MNVNNHLQEKTAIEWQPGFVAILPEIQQRLHHAFRHLSPDARDDSTADGIIHCLLSYVRLFDEGRAETVSPANLAWFAVLHVRKGRQAGCPMNVREPLSRYAQFRKGFKVERLQIFDPTEENWMNEIIEDKRASVADQVAARIDISAWFATLCHRTKCIAKDLARGFSTSETADKYHLSAGRIAQIRRELRNSWHEFQGESALKPAR